MLQRLSTFTAACQRRAAATSSQPVSLLAAAPSLSTIQLLSPPPHSHTTNTNTTITIRPRSSRSTRGLYDGRDVRFGNNVPFSLKKTRRKWSPNVQHKTLYSEILDESIKFKVTTGALRTIDKMGGLDEYLLKSRHVVSELKPKVAGKGGQPLQVRNRIVQKLKHQERLRKEAVDRGESVEVWDRIVLVGKKIKVEEGEGEVVASSSLSS